MEVNGREFTDELVVVRGINQGCPWRSIFSWKVHLRKVARTNFLEQKAVTVFLQYFVEGK